MNIKSIVIFSLVGLMVTSLGACTFVKPSVESQKVALREAHQVDGCTKKGTSVSKTVQKVGFLSRGSKKVTTELVTLAKNEAVVLGGDTIVAESDINKGEQTFGVYRCMP